MSDTTGSRRRHRHPGRAATPVRIGSSTLSRDRPALPLPRADRPVHRRPLLPLYVQGSVATKFIENLDFSWTGFVMVLVIGDAVGALAPLAAGLAHRYGRANIVVVGLFITGATNAFGLPNAAARRRTRCCSRS